jgi:Zn-dependent protease with chaperone function
MSATAPETFPIPDLAQFIERRKEGYRPMSGPDTPYAHPIDQTILRTLKSVPFQMAVNKALDFLIEFFYTDLLNNSIYVSPRSFPDAYKSLVDCSRTLGIAVPRMLAGQADFYAIYTTGTDENAFIFMSTAYSANARPEEVQFVIGHECGHIHNQHVTYRTIVLILLEGVFQLPGALGNTIRLILWPLRQTIGLALQAWSRRAEVTCDRAGLLCCKDLRVAEAALVRLLLGFEAAGKVDLDDVFEGMKRAQNSNDFTGLAQLFRSHPNLASRIECLRLFAQSELYYDLSGLPKPPGVQLLDKPTLDRRVENILKEF